MQKIDLLANKFDMENNNLSENICPLCGSYLKLINTNPDEKAIKIAGRRVCKRCQQELEKSNGQAAEPIQSKVKYPRDLKAYLDQFVIGQENAKKTLSVAVYNHYKRIRMKDPTIKKSNVLMAGPTGSGKTYMVQLIAKYLDIPMVVIDVTGITKSGYVGESVSSILMRLLIAANGNKAKAEKGIIVLDEVDKLATKESSFGQDIGGTSVQQELLKMLEGTIVQIEIQRDGHEEKICFNTESVLFICTGAFPGLEEIISKRICEKGRTVGFAVHEQPIKQDHGLMHLQTEDLLQYGLIPEFIGRLPVRVCLRELTVEELVHVIADVQDNITDQYKKLLGADEIELEFSKAAIQKIAELAYEQHTGARAIRAIMEASMSEIMFWAPGSGIERVIVDEDMICLSQDEGSWTFLLDTAKTQGVAQM